MKLVSWNVNGIRACLQKGFLNSFHQLDADIFCVQETKMQSGQADLEIEGYHYYLNSAVKKGYSGTLIYSKEKPLNVFYGMNKEEHDQEGRLITLEFENYYVITCYTPNSQNELKRLSYRMKWEDDFLTYLESLDKPIILCGDNPEQAAEADNQLRGRISHIERGAEQCEVLMKIGRAHV